MSRIEYMAGRWSPDNIIFTTANLNLGNLSLRQGQNFGASYASAILGPDLTMPGGGGNNPPMVAGYPWNLVAPFFMGGPNVTFVQDVNLNWIRGHLINGRWRAPGNTWQNLTPLTAQANANHATIESYMDRYLSASRNYENAVRRDHWYGLYYFVQCSINPLAAAPANNDLYSYAPEYIRVSWRAVYIPKPVGQPLHIVAANPLSRGWAPVAAFNPGFNLPAQPAIPGWPVAVLPIGNAPGAGGDYGALPPGFPAAQPNGFDGSIEIQQI